MNLGMVSSHDDSFSYNIETSFIMHRPATVAWCISDRENSEVIEIFFKSIKARSPDTIVNVLMTDDGILLKNEENKIAIYQTLCILLQEPSVQSFQKLV